METHTLDKNGRLLLRLEMSKGVDPGTGCWIWKGAKTKGGYGALWVDGEVKYVHRVSATLYFGFDQSSGLYVLHRCDIRACFNPDHLFTGTQADNMRDAARKGRLSRVGRGKLTREQVSLIKHSLIEGSIQAPLALEYGVSTATISQIARGKIWKDVEPSDRNPESQ